MRPFRPPITVWPKGRVPVEFGDLDDARLYAHRLLDRHDVESELLDADGVPCGSYEVAR